MDILSLTNVADEYYICRTCHFRTTLLSRINDHLLKHTGTKTNQLSPFSCFDALKPLKCISCDFTAESLLLLKCHLVRHHDQQKFALKAKLKTCKMCSFCTHSNYLWNKHRTFCNYKAKTKSKKKRIIEKVSMKKKVKWYKCEKCDYRSVRSDTLSKHVNRKHIPLEEIVWQKCTKCTSKFKTVPDLRQHKNMVHKSGIDHLQCSQCDYSTPLKQSLTKHFNRKHAVPEEIKWMECHKCDLKFKVKYDLMKHLKRHATKGKPYKCDQCSFNTHLKNSLNSHIARFHDNSAFKCDLCDYRHGLKKYLQNHMRNKHGIGDIEWLKCDLCNFQTKHKFSLKKHKKNKHGVGDFKELKIPKLLNCEHCDFSTKYKPRMNIHVLMKHNIDGKVFQCEECNYNTPVKDYLSQHMGRVHKGSRVSCEKCSYSAKTKHEVQRHMFNKHTVHTEEEKLNCANCTYFCFSKKNLINHLKIKHKLGDKIRWYECDKCDYKHQVERNLDQHKHKVHNDGKLFECDQCIFKTRSPFTMNNHKARHKMNKEWIPKTVSEKFECYICDYTTDKKANIRHHINRWHINSET